MTADPMLNIKQVAELLGVSVGCVRDHLAGRRKPFLEHHRVFGSIRIRRSTVLRVIEEGKRREPGR